MYTSDFRAHEPNLKGQKGAGPMRMNSEGNQGIHVLTDSEANSYDIWLYWNERLK